MCRQSLTPTTIMTRSNGKSCIVNSCHFNAARLIAPCMVRPQGLQSNHPAHLARRAGSRGRGACGASSCAAAATAAQERRTATGCPERSPCPHLHVPAAAAAAPCRGWPLPVWTATAAAQPCQVSAPEAAGHQQPAASDIVQCTFASGTVGMRAKNERFFKQ